MALLLDVIEFVDPQNRSLVQWIPRDGSADISYGTQLIVHQNQEAVFFRDGAAMDIFGPGRHTLTTANVPVITQLLTIPWKKSPFRAPVYFVGKQTFIDQKWGTRQPLTMGDKEFGVVPLRGFGKYSFRVTDSTILINQLVGTQGKYTTDEVSHYLRDQIVARLTDLLGTFDIGVLDLPERFDELGTATRVRAADAFAKYGLELVDFVISALVPPPDLQKSIHAETQKKTATVGATPPPATPADLRDFLRPAGETKINLAALTPATSDPRELVRKVAVASDWSVEETSKDQWAITVVIDPLRKQKVSVRFGKQDAAGHELICFDTRCGPAMEENAMTLLRYNSTLVHGAFAIESSAASEHLVLRSNQLSETADALEITRSIKAIAWQADEIEQRLLGSDSE